MYYIRHSEMRLLSKSTVEPKSNKVVFDLKLSNLVDSVVPSQSSYLSNQIRHV